jgi:hypothetical protein
MIDNQSYVQHILQLAGEDNLVDVETDSSYNRSQTMVHFTYTWVLWSFHVVKLNVEDDFIQVIHEVARWFFL